jgi:hypothetical protein
MTTVAAVENGETGREEGGGAGERMGPQSPQPEPRARPALARCLPCEPHNRTRPLPRAQARQTPEKGHGPKDPEEGEGFVCDGKAHGRSLALQEKEVERKGDGARARAGVVRAAPA